MRKQYKFFLFLFFLPLIPYFFKICLSGSFLQTNQAREIFNLASHKAEEQTVLRRLELLMALDLLVRFQHGFWKSHGEFTNSLGKIPDVLGSVSYWFNIEILQATRDRLVIVATTDSRRTVTQSLNTTFNTIDHVSIDENSNVRANFPIPPPPRDYIRLLAQYVLGQIQKQSQLPTRKELDRLEGVFKKYFNYETRMSSHGDKKTVAVGVTAPVKDELITLVDETLLQTDLFTWVYNHRVRSALDVEARWCLEKIYQVQKLFFHIRGRYARSLVELLPYSSDLVLLHSDHYPFHIQDFQLDPPFGFHVELGSNFGKRWTVNAMGQIAEVSTIETIIQQFQTVRRKISGEKLEDPYSLQIESLPQRKNE